MCMRQKKNQCKKHFPQRYLCCILSLWGKERLGKRGVLLVHLTFVHFYKTMFFTSMVATNLFTMSLEVPPISPGEDMNPYCPVQTGS